MGDAVFGSMVFRSTDGRFAVTVPAGAATALLAHARRAGSFETGGVLIGNYNEALTEAIVTELLGPPSDSRAWRSSFLRGVEGLARRLGSLWKSRSPTYY